ncbi:MAG TPA: hypothetical protein VIO43_12415 [Lutibacter sp.]
MKKSLTNARTASKAILTTAVVMAIQMLPMNSFGQVLSKAKGINSQQTKKAENIFLKIDINDKRNSIVGILNGSPVYKNDRGEYFTINAKNGDLNYISNEEFAKYVCCIYMKIGDIKGENRLKAKLVDENPINVANQENALISRNNKKTLSYIKFGGDHISDIQVIGVDKEGHTLNKNSRGETFYVDPITGDFIFVKM